MPLPQTGNKLPRGIATISSVMSYCGKPFTMLRDGATRTIIGWRGMKEVVFPGIGPRLVSHCDVPDLELLPARYPSLRTVEFRAGLELRVFTIGMYLLSMFGPALDLARCVRQCVLVHDLLEWSACALGDLVPE